MAPGPSPDPVAACADYRVRRGDERISAVVDVEQRALRALEQNALAFAAALVEQRPHRIHIGQHLWRHRGELVIDRVRRDLAHAEAAAQRIVMRQEPLDLAIEHLQVGQVHQADGAASHFIFVGRADAAAGGADGALAGGPLARDVELLVQRQDQRRVLRDPQVLRRDGDALFLKLGDLVQQRARVEHHAVADDRELAGPHHARRQQRQLISGAVDHQRMAGVMPALEAYDDVGLLGQPVDNLAFALVPPLGADHDNICHEELSPEGPMNTRMTARMERLPAAADRPG